MSDAEKTVFISYRREPSKYVAALMFHYLRDQGFDVFYDMASIDSGAFDETILHQIAARMHFIVILSPGSLDRCVNRDGSENKDDWMRREIEHAMTTQRNIIPVLMDNFDYKVNAHSLTGRLAQLPRYQSHDIPYSYLQEGLERLTKRYLKQPTNPVVIQPLTSQQVNIAETKIAEALASPIPTKEELTAEEYVTRGYQKYARGIYKDALEDLNKAIDLNPKNDLAYYHRGRVKQAQGNLDEALKDYNQALSLEQSAESFDARGAIYYHKGDYLRAVADYSHAIFMQQEAMFYNNRGEAHFANGDFQAAFGDFTKALNLKPGYLISTGGIAITHQVLGNIEEAKRLWKTLLRESIRYRDLQTLREELRWAEPLVEEAKKLIARL